MDLMIDFIANYGDDIRTHVLWLWSIEIVLKVELEVDPRWRYQLLVFRNLT